MATRLKIPHTFVLHTYTKPTKCHFCNKLLVGVIKQGVQCKDCGYNAHKKCAERVPNNCTGEVPTDGLDGVASEGCNGYDERNGEESDEEGRTSHTPEDDGTPIVTPDNFESHMAAQTTQSNIPVQRLVQSVKQTKRVGAKTIKEGWMVHFTDKENMRKRHYWRLDSKSITMFKVRVFYKEKEEHTQHLYFSLRLVQTTTKKFLSVKFLKSTHPKLCRRTRFTFLRSRQRQWCSL